MGSFLGITFNKKHSYDDLKLTLKSPPKIDEPMPRIITETVPYMNGSYDFSNLNGNLVFDNRKLVFEFNIIANNYDDMNLQFIKIKEWLFVGETMALYYDGIEDYYYTNARCTGISLNNISARHTVGAITVTFTTSPFMTNGFKEVL